MKEKTISILMLALILTNTLSVASTIKPSLAENILQNENFVKKNVETSLSGQVNDPDNGLSSGFERKPDANQEKTLKTTSQTSQNPDDKWDFGDKSEWSNFTYVDGDKTRLIVGVDGQKPTSLLELEKIAVKHEAKIVNTVSFGGEIRAIVVELLFASVTAFVQEVRVVGLASYVEPNMKVQALFFPNDPDWDIQWGPQKIEADWAWNTTVGDPSVLVAVVDTGIYYTHPDLSANYVALGYDWVNNDADPLDDHGHGTHCAGIIAATINNGIGIAGLAQVRVMAEKVLDSGGGGYWDWVANGIINATDCGARIISMSLGGYGDSELVHDAVKYAYEAGVLVIAAAGNDNTNTKLYPAGYDEVIAVAATDQYDNKAWFSNWGDWIELAAPGVSIYSTVPWGYESWSGTSMACPHVSGVASLVWSLYPGKTRDWVRLWLRYTANDLGDLGFDVYYGYGRVNARKAVEQTPPAHELIAYNWITPPYVEPGASGTVNATILNFGENETDVIVQLLANGTIADSAMIDFLAAGNSTTVSLLWVPAVEGLYNITLYVVPVPGETSLENNILWKYVYVGFPVKAVVLHSAGNIDGRIITNWQVLSSEWCLFGDTMVYVDYATLNKEDISYADIASTQADVLIISCAYDPYVGWQFTNSEIEAITQYVHEGHGLIATAGTLYYGVPNNNKLAPLFGLDETIMWTGTGTDLLHLLNTTHPAFANVPNPLVFPAVETALPYDGRWDSNELVGGNYLALGHYQESAIVTYRGLVYISPWLEIIQPYYHHPLQLLYNAMVWSRYQKPEHELVVSLQCPTHLKPGESVSVNATVQNMGLNNETNVELHLLFDGTEVANFTVPTLAIGELETLSYLWTPTEGTYNVTAFAPPIPGEEETFNNVKTIHSRVSYAAVIGFIETHGESLHSDELKFYYESLGHIVITIYSSLTPELLADYDILIVGEDWYNNPWSPSEIAAVQDFIRSGKGFVGIGDELAYPVQDILNEYGIAYTGYYGYAGSSSNFDHSHPLMEGVNYIYASSPVNSLQTVPPAYWIANDAYNVYMLIAGAEARGYVLCMSDDFAASVYSDDNEIMFANMVEWMAFRYEHDLAVFLEAPVSLELGKAKLLNATVRNRGLNNETNVELYLLINGTVVTSATISELMMGESYTINYNWVPTGTGNYNITAYAPPVLEEDQVSNNFVTKIVIVWFYMRLYLPHEWIGAGDPMGWHADDASWQYTLPFDFPFYGVGYRTIYISSNGMITFLGPDASYWNSMPELASRLAIAVAWDDWITYYPYDIYIWQNSSHVGIRWYAQHISSGAAASFEAILSADGVIRCNYDYNDGPISATIGISNGAGHIIAEDAITLNYINTIVFLPFQLEHDLTVSLEAYGYLELGGSMSLNATVYNMGLNNETDVELQLLIDSAVVDFVLIPELPTGTSYTLNYVWSPTIKGIYNVTAYAPPLTDEEFTANNVATKFVTVRVAPRLLVVDTPWPEDTGALDKLRYEYTLVSPTEFATVDLSRFNVLFVGWQPGDDVVNSLFARAPEIADWLAAGNGIVALSEFYETNRWAWLPLWAGTVEWSGDGVQIIEPTHPVMQNLTNADLSSWGLSYYGCFNAQHEDWRLLALGTNWPFYQITLAATYGNGRIVITQQDPDYAFYYNNQPGAAKLLENMIKWATPPEHELVVSLDVPKFLEPNTPILLNATISNIGLRIETDAELQLIVNYTVIDSVLIPELLPGTSNVLSHLWTPAEGVYNVTAYAPPVLGEEIITNNVATQSVIVRPLKHVLFDQTHETENIAWFSTWVANLAQKGYIVDTQTSEPITPTVLASYDVFVIPRARQPYNPSELSAIKNFVYMGGGLLVIGDDEPSIYTDLTGFAGIIWTAGGTTGFTTNITPHEVTLGVSLVYLANPTTTILVRGAVQDLVRDWYENIVLAVSLDHVIGFADQDSLGDVSIVIADNLQLAINMIEWLAADKPLPTIHDVAIVSAVASATEVYAGGLLNITVVALNEGNVTETFDVTAYYDITPIETVTIHDLAAGANVTITFSWNTSGLAIGNYTISAVASTILGEIDLADNRYINGWVIVTWLGDSDGDFDLDEEDLWYFCAAFITYSAHHVIDPRYDFDGDHDIDEDDLWTFCAAFIDYWKGH